MTGTKLEGGVEVVFNGMKGKCKSCGSRFIWGVTKNNKGIPVVKVDDKFVSHFSNCSGAGEYRKGRG